MNAFSALIGLLLFFNLISCTSRSPACSAGYAAINTYAKKMHDQNEWYLYGIGGSFDGVVKKLYFDFMQYNETDVDMTRKLLIQATEDFLKQANQDTKLIPHMEHYPFTFQNVKIGMSFYDKKTGKRVAGQYISFAYLMNGKIYYHTYDENTDKLVDGPVETYAEAYKIVMGHDLPEPLVPAPSYLTATTD